MPNDPAFELPEPPAGSVIQVEQQDGAVSLSWPPQRGHWFRYLIAAFLAVWLCGWFAGLVSAIKQLAAGEGPQAFLVFWLAGWTIGGVFVVAILYMVLRPTQNERVHLGDQEFRHDPGRKLPRAFVDPFYAFRQGGFVNPYAELFRATVERAIPRDSLLPFVLSDSSGRQRLTYDIGADRIEVGDDLREPEREWLAIVLEDWRTA